MDCKKNKAFTLAEVLITLGVIGVVSAITMPTLIQNHKEKATITALKKAYSQVSQAYQYLSMEYGPISSWADWDDEDKYGENVLKMAEMFCTRLKCLKICAVDDDSCSPKEIFNTREDRSANRSRTPAQYYGNIYSKAILADGTGLAFHPTQIEADINGLKAPNTPSLDVFILTVEDNKIYPRGINNGDNIQSFENYCLRYGHACSAWVLTNENMDYLKCPEKLSWDGKHSCKE